MEKRYHIGGKESSEELGGYLARSNQILLPMVEWTAGPPHPGKKGGSIGWHGRETGAVCLKERKLRVKRPPLRKKAQGEQDQILIPAREATRREELWSGAGTRVGWANRLSVSVVHLCKAVESGADVCNEAGALIEGLTGSRSVCDAECCD